MLESAIKPANYKGPNIEILVRNLNDSNEESFDIIMKQIMTKNDVKVGKIIAEPGLGNLVDEWKKVVETHQSQMEFLDCSMLIDDVLKVKDPEELENIR